MVWEVAPTMVGLLADGPFIGIFDANVLLFYSLSQFYAIDYDYPTVGSSCCSFGGPCASLETCSVDSFPFVGWPCRYECCERFILVLIEHIVY